MFGRVSVLAILLAALVSAAAVAGEGDVFIYDAAVSEAIDVDQFTKTGQVTVLEGPSDFCETEGGPAPPPYPQIHVWEPGYEQLGASSADTDGIWFVTPGKHWKKHRLVLVLWKIRIPKAGYRLASEFERDLTLSLWVDWDQNESWDKDELLVRKNVDIERKFPTDKESVCVYYLTCFRVPDVTKMATASSWWWNRGKSEIRHYWVRGSVAYDNTDVSPDGEQLFGEAEDYRVSYKVTGKPEGR